jgi:hypothetical protein
MIDAYKRFPVKCHVIAIIALTGLALLLGWSVNEPWLVGGFAFGILLLLHFFMTKLNSLLALIAIIMQLVAYACLMVGFSLYGESTFSLMGISHDLAFYGLACYAVTVTAFYLYVAYKFSRGRMWINLSTAFLLMWITSLAIIVINPVWYVTALTVGFVSGLVFLIARIPNRKKKESFTRPLLSKEVRIEAEQLFKKNGLEFVKLDKESCLKGHYFAYNDHSAFLINVVKPTEQFSVTSSGIISDGLNLVPMLENAQESILISRKEINPDMVASVLLVLSPFHNLQSVMSVTVSRWKQPDNMLGVMNILTAKGFSRFIRATKGEMKILREDKQMQIKKIAEKLTSN